MRLRKPIVKATVKAIASSVFLWTLSWLSAPVLAQELNFLEAIFDDQSGVDGLAQASAIAISPDQRHVYVGGSELVAGFPDPVQAWALSVFDRDPATGRLSFVDAVIGKATAIAFQNIPNLPFPSDLVVSPDGGFLYLRAEDGLLVFARNATTGMPLQIDQIPRFGGRGRLAIDANNLYSSAGTSLRAFERLANGRLRELLPFGGAGSPAGLDGAWGVHLIGNQILVASENDGQLTTFQRNPDGTLVVQQAVGPGSLLESALGGARAVASSPDGASVYVASPTSRAIAILSRDPATGEVAPVDSIVLDEQVGRPNALSVSPDGSRLYATTEGNSLAIFERDPLTGGLAFLRVLTDNLNGVRGLISPRDTAVSQDGRHVYAASAGSGSIAVFTTDASAGPGCTPDGGTLCLQGGRFHVTLDWRSQLGASGSGLAQSLSDSSGTFAFFSADNREMLIKVLDGCDENQHFWVFFAATTNQEFEVTVTDTQTQEVRSYFNPLLTPALPVQDTSAFATCP